MSRVEARVTSIVERLSRDGSISWSSVPTGDTDEGSVDVGVRDEVPPPPPE